MDRLLSMIGDPVFTTGLVAVALAVVTAALGVGWLVAPPAEGMSARLERAVHLGGGGGGAVSSDEHLSWFGRVIKSMARVAKPSGDEASQVRDRLAHAGLRGRYAFELLFGAKVALALALCGLFLVVVALYGKPIPMRPGLAVIAAAVGFYAPNVWLVRRAARRQLAIARSLPDALDLLVTCVEAGLGVEAAIARIVDEIGMGAPVLAEELSQTMLEIRAGVVRSEAFRRLAARTGVEELRALSATLVQTEMFGTSVGRALRLMAEGLRIRRSQYAEERAATVGTKMVIPLILCILPSLFAVILGPAVLRVIHTLLPTLGAQ